MAGCGTLGRRTGDQAASEFEGRTGDDCAEQPARWVSVAQPVDGVGIWSRETRDSYAYAGLAIFDHPDNFRFPKRL